MMVPEYIRAGPALDGVTNSPETNHEKEFAVSIESVAKRFQSSRGKVDAVTETSLRVESGAFVSLVGPSGCGKTTMLRMIAGLEKPTTGRIAVRGQTVTGPGLHVGLMFQHSVLLPWRDVLENILLPIVIRKDKKADYLDRAHELLKLVKLDGFERHAVNELSGGMQQRVALCRALIADPSVLLLDEPFGALDSITREQLNDLLLSVCSTTHKTTLLVTHDIDEAVYMADRVVVMTPRPGRVEKILDVDLPRPRSYMQRRELSFGEYTTEVRRLLGIVSQEQ
jgi:NitT/TauT family transport system ATP-binding protein